MDGQLSTAMLPLLCTVANCIVGNRVRKAETAVSMQGSDGLSVTPGAPAGLDLDDVPPVDDASEGATASTPAESAQGTVAAGVLMEVG